MSVVDGGWVIGDHLTADIAGGRAAGLQTIWIDRGTWPVHEPDADHVVTDALRAMEILNREPWTEERTRP
ncbi:HAD hydrolase-like protein [Microtetraspora malaysiensis]|uniref:HAD hydrolase-like protein n=1 Tax=Microtetraspora malaysiensis TaxID=161358 RepID=UPI003D8B490E